MSWRYFKLDGNAPVKWLKPKFLKTVLKFPPVEYTEVKSCTCSKARVGFEKGPAEYHWDYYSRSPFEERKNNQIIKKKAMRKRLDFGERQCLNTTSVGIRFRFSVCKKKKIAKENNFTGFELREL
jgi:hypothetical protein